MPEFGDPNGNGKRGQSFMAASFVILGLAFYFVPSGLQQGVASGIRLTLLRPFVSIRGAVSVLRVRGLETDALRAQLDSLHVWITNNAPAVEENQRLRALGALAPRVDGIYRAASVYRPGNLGSQATLVLDLGREDGVQTSSPVITPQGLAGRIVEAHETISIGMDWTHPDFRASVMTEDGELYGIVRPEPAAFGEVNRLLLTGAPYYSGLADGVLVVTSGLGGVFPRGVPVGRIGGLAESDEGWHRSYWIYPSVHPASVTHALVGVPTRIGPESEHDLSPLFRQEAAAEATSGDPPSDPPATGDGRG